MSRHLEPVDPDHYRKAIGRLATGVSVVTTQVGDIDYAMTINSLTSVSLEPVLMLISVEREARFYEAVVESGKWAISILGAQDRAAATWLATRGRPIHGQLDQIPHHRGEATGLALIDDALAEFECETVSTTEAGDHVIFVGRVLGMALSDNPDDALTYYRGAFGRLA